MGQEPVRDRADHLAAGPVDAPPQRTHLSLRNRVFKVPFRDVLGLVFGRVRAPELSRPIGLAVNRSIGVTALLTEDLPLVGILGGGHPVTGGVPGPTGTQGVCVRIVATDGVLS